MGGWSFPGTSGFLDNLETGAGNWWDSFQELLSTPKRGLDYLSALDPLGISGGSKLKLDSEGNIISPTIGESIGPAFLPPPEEEETPIAKAIRNLSPGGQLLESDSVRRITSSGVETGIDIASDPSLAAMAIPGVAPALLPSMIKGSAEGIGSIWSEFDKGEGFTPEAQDELGRLIPSLAMAGLATHGTLKGVPKMAKAVPEIGLGESGYSSRSPINLEPSNSRPVSPAFGSSIIERGSVVEPTSEVKVYSGGDGTFWTTNPKRAASYGPVREVTVPKEIFEAGRLEASKLGQPSPTDTVIPNEWAKRASENPNIHPDVHEITDTGQPLQDILSEYLPVEGPSTPRPIELGNFIDKSARDLDYTDDPFSNLRSKVVEGENKAKPVLSENAKTLKDIIKYTKATKFTPETLVSNLEKAGLNPGAIKAELPGLLGELEQAGYLNKKATGTYTFNQAPVKGNVPTITPKPISAMGPESLSLEDVLKSSIAKNEAKQKTLDDRLKAAKEAGLSDAFIASMSTGHQGVWKRTPGAGRLPIKEISDADIQAIKSDLISKPVSAMTGGESLPLKPSTPSEVALEPTEGKPSNYTVTLNDGTDHLVRARSAEEAQAKAEEILSNYGSEKQVTNVKERISSLERAAQSEVNPPEIKAQEELTQAQALEEINNLKQAGKISTEAEKVRIQSLDKIYKAQTVEELAVRNEELRASEKESNLREQAHEAELKGQLKVEENYSRTQERLKRQEAIRAQRELKAKANAPRESGLWQALGGIKALASSGDLGHILRQGKQATLYLLTHKPSAVAKAFKDMGKQTFSEKEFNNFHATLAKDPKISRMARDFNLDIPGIEGHLGEEAFHYGSWAEKVPVLGRYIRASDRAYTSYLNSLRTSLAHEGISRLEKQGLSMDKSPEHFRELSRGINIITQRGDFSPKTALAFTKASNIFWAPRAKVSRLQQVGEAFRPGESGRLARQGLVHAIGFNMLMLGALKAQFGDKAEFITDPERTDFLKIRVGNTTVDPWFGLASPMRNAIQGLTGVEKSGVTGRTRTTSVSDQVGQEITNSLAPGIVMLYEMIAGKSPGGFLVGKGEALSNVLPLSARDMKEIFEEQGVEGLLMAIMAYAGENIGVYNPEKEKVKQDQLKRDRGIPVSSRRSRASSSRSKHAW